MSISHVLLMSLAIASGWALMVPIEATNPGYFLNMLMWNGKESDRYHQQANSPVMQAVTTDPKWPLTVIHCPAPFFPVMSQCFYVSRHHKLSWDDSRTFCSQMGGDLAQPLHLYSLMVYLQDNYPDIKEFHLGASDINEEGNWTYLNGRPVDPIAWMPGEPSDPGHEQNCLNFCFEGCAASYPPLNDMFCHWERNFVCEFSVE